MVVVTIQSSYGLENILYTIYLLFLLVVWFYIYSKTKPFEMKDNNLLGSSINGVNRLLCYLWFITIFIMAKGIIFVSSDSNFLDSKLYIINIGYYITFTIWGLLLILIFIKHYSKVTGLQDFLDKVIYEVKNG